jgi:hypothetical protein
MPRVQKNATVIFERCLNSNILPYRENAGREFSVFRVQFSGGGEPSNFRHPHLLGRWMI